MVRGVVDEGGEEVLFDEAEGLAGELQGGGEGEEVSAEEGDVGGGDGDVGAGADGDADAGAGECGGVVDAVADHGDDFVLGVEGLDVGGFLGGGELGEDFGDAELLCDGVCGGGVVSGEHDDLEVHGF